jgi:hypothetical protein
MTENLTTKLGILPTLRERLNAVDEELAAMTRRRGILLELRSALEALIAKEEQVRGEGEIDETIVPALHPTGANRSLSDYIVRALATGPKSLEQLKQVGAHWGALRESNSPGRALNFALVGLQKGKHVERLKDGSWKLIPAKAGDDTDPPQPGIRRRV